MTIHNFEEFVNEAEVQRKKVIASDGTECRALIKYCNKNGDLASAMNDLLKANNYVEKVEDYTQKLAAFKFQSAVREADLPNCMVLLYKDGRAAKNDVARFIEEPARAAKYWVYRDAVQKKDDPRNADFLLISESPAKDLTL